jgi:hypothetical protein
MSNTYIPIKLIDYQDKWKDIEAFVKEHISDNVRTHGRTEEGKLVQKCFGYIAEKKTRFRKKLSNCNTN